MTSGHLTFVAQILLFRISLSHVSSYGDIFQRANCYQSHICPWFRSHLHLVFHHALLLGLIFFFPTNFSFPSDMPHINSRTFWFSFLPTLPPPDHLSLSWWLFFLVLYLKHSLNMMRHAHLNVFSFYCHASYLTFLLGLAQHSNGASCKCIPAYPNHRKVLTKIYLYISFVN